MRASIVWLTLAACSSAGGNHVEPPPSGPPTGGGANGGASARDCALSRSRERLLDSYLAQLHTTKATRAATSCELWTSLSPSAHDVFLSITHRLHGTRLADGSRALDHVTKLYRLAGGEAASAANHGSCGGGEWNRMIMHSDATLHRAQLAAFTRKGAKPYDLADVAGGFWRDSHDVGGTHEPFDASCETDDGAPRGQTQFFRDPTSAVARAPLHRHDLETLVDPYAFEMDQDYNCAHDSNPDCTYVAYGKLCTPQPERAGTQIYAGSYGAFDPAWQPRSCATPAKAGSSQPSWTGSGATVAPAEDGHTYRWYDIDFSHVAAGTQVSLEVTTGGGASSTSVDLFPPGATVLATGYQTDSICTIYDQTPSSTAEATCSIDKPGVYRFGIEGNWFSGAGATNTLTWKFTAAEAAAGDGSAATGPDGCPP